MSEQGYEEGVDWDFYYYIDSWKFYAPLCAENITDCDLEGTNKAAEDFIIYKDYQGVETWISKQKYHENEDFLPSPDFAQGINFEELSVWYAFKDALNLYASRGQRTYWVYMTDDVKFINPNGVAKKWNLG